jgi:hypothetical protein
MTISSDEYNCRLSAMAQQAADSCVAHEVRLNHIEENVRQMMNDIRTMRDILSQAQGSWRALVMIGGLCGSIGAVASWTVSHITTKP